MTFPDIHMTPDETIRFILRKHVFSFAFIGLVAVFFLLCVIAFLFYQEVLLPFVSVWVYWLLFAFIWVSGWVFIFLQSVDILLGVTVITEKRMCTVREHSIFSREVVDTPLEMVQSLRAEVSGFFGSMFWYGRILIKTSNPNSDRVLTFISNPLAVAKELNSLIEEIWWKNTHSLNTKNTWERV